MVTDNRNYQFEGALATRELVGRKDLIGQFKKILAKKAKTPRIIFYWAQGGMGKTRLVKELLKIAKAQKGVRVVKTLVDLYHVNTHTPNGFADALYDALEQPSDIFAEYQEKRKTLQLLLARGEVSKATEAQRQEALSAFNNCIQAATAKMPLVIALDTAEKAIYGKFDNIFETAEGWEWFCKSFPKWGNVIILLAGREQSKELLKNIKHIVPPEAIELVEIKRFTEKESLEYFEEVRKTAVDLRAVDIVKKLDELDETIKKAAHFCSNGVPIMLAVMTENLSGKEGIPSVLFSKLEDLKKKSPKEMHGIREKFEKQLVDALMPTQIGETIVALGRAPKGVDEKLLSLLLGVSVESARVRLQEVKSLSFVKKRPSDERVFLHDEMYGILNRRVFYDNPEDDSLKEKGDNAIRQYYREAIDENLIRLNSLFAPIENGRARDLDSIELIKINSERVALLTEDVYYRLRQNPIKGYRRFYRYVREATLSGNVMLESHLQSELASFLSEIQKLEPFESEVYRNLFSWSVLLRRVTRAWASQRYDLALSEAAKIRKKHAKTLQQTSPGSEAMLSTWEAYTLILYKHNLNDAQKKLDRAIQLVEGALVPSDEPDVVNWRLSAVLGFAYRVRGYLFRVKGLLGPAVEDYRRAVFLFRKVNLRIELATTLNDMGFAMSEQGNSVDARVLIEDALRIRYKLGQRVPIGQSYSTLATLDVKDGRYKDAVDNAERALSLFAALNDERRSGMAYNVLSEAQRRYSGTLADPTARIQWLRDALDSAEKAYQIFDKIGERSRQAEALIESGCAYRDWVRVRSLAPSGRDDIEQLAKNCERDLRKAAKLAGKDTIHFQIDALIDLAWLRYYQMREGKQLESVIREVEKAIPDGYFVSEKKGVPDIPREQAHVQIWSEMGKLYVLRGQYHFGKYYYEETPKNSWAIENKAKGTKERVKNKEQLELAAENYFYGLQHSAIFSSSYHALNKAKGQVYDNLKNLREEELIVISKKIRQLGGRYNLDKNNRVMEDFLKFHALWYGD
ncbi:MAG: ATP-binding protein [Chloroflexi bacterium]|nr:ATP-binding protein [Chloroflexota bacterium]